jgi:hypothetical protein
MLLAARRCLGRMDVATRPALRAPNEPELIVEPVSGPGTEQLLLDDQLGVGGPTGPEIQRPPRGRLRPDPLAASRPRRRNRCRGARDPAAGRGPAGSVSAAQPYPIPIRRLSCSAPPVVVQHAAPPTARSRPDDPCSAPPVVPRHPAPPPRSTRTRRQACSAPAVVARHPAPPTLDPDPTPDERQETFCDEVAKSFGNDR